MQHFLFIFFLVFGKPLHANSVPLGEDFQSFSLGQYLEYFEDPDSTFNSFNSLKDKSSWLKSQEDVLNFGFSRSNYWARVHIKNTLDIQKEYYLEFSYPLLDHLLVYLVRDSDVKETKLGDLLPFESRGVKYHNFLVPFTLAPQESVQVYIRFHSLGPVILPVTIWSGESFIEHSSNANIGYGIYFGIMLAMVSYNLFLYLMSLKKSYLYYSGYITLFSLFQASGFGYSYKYLWPESSLWNNLSYLFFITSSCSLLGLFVQDFLNSHLEKSRFSWVMRGFSGLFAFHVILLFSFEYSIAAKFITLSVPLFMIAIVANMTYRYIKGYRPARFFILAFIFILIGAIVYALRAMGILPSNGFTDNAPLLGSALEVILLSLALGDKIKIQQKESKQEIRQLNDELLGLNASLEEQVEIKTKKNKAILQNISQGIFTISLNQAGEPMIDSDYSPALEAILERKDLSGENPIKTIFAKSKMSEDQISILNSAIQLSIGYDSFQWECNAFHVPSKLHLKKKVLHCSFDLIINEGLVSRVLVTLHDVTALEAAEARIEESKNVVERILQITAISETDFLNFVKSASNYIEENHHRLKKDTTLTISLKETLFRNIHTLKGLSRMLGFSQIANKCHIFEDKLSGSKLNDEDLHEDLLLLNLNIQAELESLHAVAETKLQINVDDSKVSIPKRIVKNWYERLRDDEERDTLLDELKDLYSVRYADILEKLTRDVPRLAKKLGKPTPKVFLDCPLTLYLPVEQVPILMGVLVHLIRNAVDHGIEPEVERRRVNKSPEGRIDIIVRQQVRGVKIHFKDDGRGINLQTLKEKAKDLKLIDEGEEDWQKISKVIFVSGVSTKDTVSDISGRGVGMDAVKKTLEDSGSSIGLEKYQIDENNYLKFGFEIDLNRKFLEF